MGDVERITTTERHAALREQVASDIATADGYNPAPDPALWELDRDRYLALADAVLPFIEQAKAEVYEQARSNWPRMLTSAEAAAFNRGLAAGRVRVVEGLVATIKALPTLERMGHSLGSMRARNADEFQADVLAVVEAAREDTT